MNTLNDLARFGASVVPAQIDETLVQRDAQKTFMVAADHVAGAILSAENDPEVTEPMTFEEALGDLFWALAAISVAYKVDLDSIVDQALPRFKAQHEKLQRMRENPIDFLLKELGLSA